MEKLRQSLLLMHLKHHGHSQSLRILAFQQLIEKNLIHLGDNAYTASEIGRLIAKAIGVKNVDIRYVKEALNLLQQEGRASQSESHHWKLNSKIKKEINDEIQYFDKELDYIVETYFSSVDMGRKARKEWFTDACAGVFGKYGDLFISSIANHESGFEELIIDDALSSSISQHDLQAHERALIESFTIFLYSKDQRVQAYLHNVAMAMVATKVVAANIGTDPVNLDNLRVSSYCLIQMCSLS